MSSELKIGDAVLVTTEHRGVFFGYFCEWLDNDHKHIGLTKCRNCISWPSSVRGFLGLAETGPDSGCRIGPAADVPMLRDVTSVSRVTDDAVLRWEAAPWS